MEADLPQSPPDGLEQIEQLLVSSVLEIVGESHVEGRPRQILIGGHPFIALACAVRALPQPLLLTPDLCAFSYHVSTPKARTAMIHGGGARLQRVGHHPCGERCDVRNHGRVLRRCEPEVSEARRLKSLEGKGRRLKELLADFMLDVACRGPGAAMNSLTRSPDLGMRIHRSMREKAPFLWIFSNDLAGFGGSDPSSATRNFHYNSNT